MNGLHYISLHGDSGYAEAGRRVLRALLAIGVPVTWTPMVQGMGWGLGYEPARPGDVDVPADLAPICHHPLACDTAILHTVPEYYPRWRSELLGRAGPRPLLLAHTVWETTALPTHWPALLRHTDAVLVPGEWNRQIFATAIPELPVATLPHPCLPAERADPPRRSRERLRFYSINTWSTRKALDRLVHAFLQTFDADDPVELVIKTTSEDRSLRRNRLAHALFGPATSAAALRRVVEGYANPARVDLITERLDDDELRALHARGDCYVTLARGEGWGLGSFDAATHGRPVVATAFGGALDYLDAETSYLVRYQSVPVDDPQGGRSYTRDQRWAEPDLDHAGALLREVADDPNRAGERARRLAARIQTRFDGASVARRLLADIEAIRALRRSAA